MTIAVLFALVGMPIILFWRAPVLWSRRFLLRLLMGIIWVWAIMDGPV